MPPKRKILTASQRKLLPPPEAKPDVNLLELDFSATKEIYPRLTFFSVNVNLARVPVNGSPSFHGNLVGTINGRYQIDEIQRHGRYQIDEIQRQSPFAVRSYLFAFWGMVWAIREAEMVEGANEFIEVSFIDGHRETVRGLSTPQHMTIKAALIDSRGRNTI
jgi:hypothetical protein